MEEGMAAEEHASLFWKALADTTRRRMLDMLRAGPRTTSALAGGFPHLSRFAVMKHLGVLEEAGLVIVERRGRERWNSLNAVPLRQMYQRWVSTLDDQWATSLLDIGHLATTHHAERTRAMTDTQTVSTISIRQEHRIAADRAAVFHVLTTRIGDWHRHPFRLHQGDAEVRLDPRPGGTLGEHWDEGFAIWATVSVFEPDTALILHGTWGTPGAVAGRISFRLEPEGGMTMLRFEHQAIGEFDPSTSGSYEHGWNEILGNLKELAEGSVDSD
jgi:DNA-binding transcriptional ArsR family regulator